VYRANLMSKMHARSLAELIRMVMDVDLTTGASAPPIDLAQKLAGQSVVRWSARRRSRPDTMHKTRILIIAPTSDLQRSLRFAVEAEQYDVTWRASIGATMRPDQFDCTIVDHHALGDDPSAARLFAEAFQPAILLANGPHPLSPFVFRTILKPHLGPAVTAAIRDALLSVPS
jgi:hypothetical protein